LSFFAGRFPTFFFEFGEQMDRLGPLSLGKLNVRSLVTIVLPVGFGFSHDAEDFSGITPVSGRTLWRRRFDRLSGWAIARTTQYEEW
jgi:hypothetical protein